MNTQDLEWLLGEVTPGEWNASPGYEQRNGQRYWQVQNEFDAIMQNQFCWAQGSHEANASLIAMAPDLAREVIALRAKVAVADALVEAAGCWLNIAAHCAIEDGSCCCGDDMKNHPSPMNCGHTPVDHGSYVADHAIKTTEVALAAWEAAQ